MITQSRTFPAPLCSPLEASQIRVKNGSSRSSISSIVVYRTVIQAANDMRISGIAPSSTLLMEDEGTPSSTDTSS